MKTVKAWGVFIGGKLANNPYGMPVIVYRKSDLECPHKDVRRVEIREIKKRKVRK